MRQITRLMDCDHEPIATPGYIQPHGVLLAVDVQSLCIVQVSANCAHWLAVEPQALLQQPLAHLLGEAQLQDIQSHTQDALTQHDQHHCRIHLPVRGQMQPFDLLWHVQGKLLILELEPCTQAHEAEALAQYQKLQKVL